MRDDRGRTLPPPPYALENDGVVQPGVDAFERRVFTDAAGTRLAFRLFRPDGHLRAYPLVLVLHGGGETGSPQVRPANVTQITANRSAIVWATRPKEPVYVVAPQLPGRTSQWTEPAIQAAVMALVGRLAGAYPIDMDRIYLTGLSRGGRGAVELLSQHPETFAGALLAAARAERCTRPTSCSTGCSRRSAGGRYPQSSSESATSSRCEDAEVTAGRRTGWGCEAEEAMRNLCAWLRAEAGVGITPKGGFTTPVARQGSAGDSP